MNAPFLEFPPVATERFALHVNGRTHALELEPRTHLAGAHHSVAALPQWRARHFGQRQQAAQHVIHHSTGIAARRASPRNVGGGQMIEVEVVGAYGAGADETHRATL